MKRVQLRGFFFFTLRVPKKSKYEIGKTLGFGLILGFEMDF